MLARLSRLSVRFGQAIWCAWLWLCALPLSAHASDAAPNYPARPITLVVPFFQGGHPDQVARLLAKTVQAHLPSAQLEVVNRIGDSGVTAATDVRDSAPDGYTLLLGRVATHAIAPARNKELPYRWNDFTLLGMLEVEPQVCIVSGTSPYQNLRQLIDAARKKPGTLKFGHTGESTILYLSVRYLQKLEGLKQSDLQPVNLAKGNRTILDSVVQGEVDFACAAVTATMVDYIRDQRLRALFSTAPGRHPQMPQLRNAREVGLPDLSNMLGWSALMGPPGMPKHVVQAWKTALAKLARDPVWNAELQKLGAIQVLGTLRDNDRYLQQQFRLYERIVDSLGSAR